MPGATFSSTLRFSTIASGGTRPWAISARPSSRALPWRHELTMVSPIPGEDHPRLGAANRIVGPLLRQVKIEGNRQAAPVIGQGQRHGDLAVILLAQLAAVLILLANHLRRIASEQTGK